MTGIFSLLPFRILKRYKNLIFSQFLFFLSPNNIAFVVKKKPKQQHKNNRIVTLKSKFNTCHYPLGALESIYEYICIYTHIHIEYQRKSPCKARFSISDAEQREQQALTLMGGAGRDAEGSHAFSQVRCPSPFQAACKAQSWSVRSVTSGENTSLEAGTAIEKGKGFGGLRVIGTKATTGTVWAHECTGLTTNMDRDGQKARLFN